MEPRAGRIINIVEGGSEAGVLEDEVVARARQNAVRPVGGSAPIVVPPRRPSRSDRSNQGLPAIARRTISQRSGNGRSPASGLWGGAAAGTKTTFSRPKRSRTSSAMRRWAIWIGLKVPPKMPIFK